MWPHIKQACCIATRPYRASLSASSHLGPHSDSGCGCLHSCGRNRLRAHGAQDPTAICVPEYGLNAAVHRTFGQLIGNEDAYLCCPIVIGSCRRLKLCRTPCFTVAVVTASASLIHLLSSAIRPALTGPSCVKPAVFSAFAILNPSIDVYCAPLILRRLPAFSSLFRPQLIPSFPNELLSAK